MIEHIYNNVRRHAKLLILLIAVWAAGLTAQAATWTAYFLNDPGWSNVHAWVWDGDSGNSYTNGLSWPGMPCELFEVSDPATGDIEQYYTYTFTTEDNPTNLMIIFNDGSKDSSVALGTQTADMEFVNNGIYNYSGFTGQTMNTGDSGAGTVTITPDPATNLTGTTSGSNIQPLDSMADNASQVAFTFSYVSGTAPAYYANGSAIRLYTGNTFTVESADRAIEKIVFHTSKNKENENTLQLSDNTPEGTVSFDTTDRSFTWTAAAGSPVNYLEFKIVGTQYRFTSVDVYFAAEGSGGTVTILRAPAFSRSDGLFNEEFQLTITDPNSPAASIYYTLDGTEPSATNGTLYTAPFTIPGGADATVKAIAVSGEAKSAVTTASYTWQQTYDLAIRAANRSGISSYYVSTNSIWESSSVDKTYKIPNGEYVTLEVYTNDNYKLSMTNNGTPVEQDYYYSFQMPDYPVEIVLDAVYDPASPGDPQPGDVDKKYNLTLVTNPTGAGSTYGAGSYKAGEQVRVDFYAQDGYKFTGELTMNGQPMTDVTSSSFQFTMPAGDVVITASYVYAPTSPGDPEQPKLKHPLSVVAMPAGAATFDLSASEVEYGSRYTVYAYPQTGYKFKQWILNGVPQEWNSTTYYGVMTDKGAQLICRLEYDPDSPANPGANYYNPETGQVIMDDFAAGNLYDALQKLIGSYDFSNISSIIVKGVISSYDISDLSRNLSNVATIDLSRTGGFDTVEYYTFDSSTASSIILPSVVSEFGGYAFNGCSNLTSLTLHATVPPTCASDIFNGFTNKDNCTLYVPAESLSLYAEADYWKDFTILPITDDAHVLQVNLPADAADGRYKNNSLEIVNINTGVRQKYVISDRMLYTFNGMQKDEQYNVYMFSQAGLEIGKIENVVIPDNDSEVTFAGLKPLYSVSAQVLAPDNTDVTADATVEWLKPLADGTTTYLRKAVALGDVPQGQALICRITLPEKLGTQYSAPADTEYVVEADQSTCAINLQPLRTVTLTGTVVDSEGNPLDGASVSANQTLNGKYPKSYTAKTDAGGHWSMTVLDAPQTNMTYAAFECVNLNEVLDAFAADVTTLDLGCKALKSIVGARVSYGFTYLEAGADAPAEGYDDYKNVAISVYNVTQDRPHNELSLQYPLLAVLDENIAVGDQLRLTATSKNGAFNPIEKTVTVGDDQRAEVTFDIVGKGGIAASFEMTDNPAVVAMLYNENGELIKKQDYVEAKTTFTLLPDGNYTLITMGRSTMMNSILRLASFPELGLTEGKDYVKNAATVQTGKLTAIANPTVPAFDESLFTYTNEQTNFSTNKSSLSTGNYLTLRATIDFKTVYKSDINDVALVVDLPEACSLVDKSVIQGPNQLPYTLDGQRLTVQLGNNYTSQVRFCVTPTAGGRFNATGTVAFDYQGNRVSQPLGAAVCEVKDLEITVPKSTASTKFNASGTAAARATVEVYVDGVVAATAKANAVGYWSTQCELSNPENFSAHTVYASFAREDNVKLNTETKEVVYNPLDVTVRNVSMTFFNGWNHKQYEVVWDFEQGTVSTPHYDFYTTTDFTFIADIAYHDRDLLPVVWINAHTSTGNIRYMRATYDENLDKWVATSRFSSDELPTNVSVSLENLVFSLTEDASYELLLNEHIGDISLGEPYEGADGNTVVPVYDKDGNKIGEIEGYESGKTLEELIEELLSQGYEQDADLNDDHDYVVSAPDDVADGVTSLVNPDNGSVVIIDTSTGKPRVVIIRLISEEGHESVTEQVAHIICRSWRQLIVSYFDEDTCERVENYNLYTEHLEKYVTITTSLLIARTIWIDYAHLPEGLTHIPGAVVLSKIRRLSHSAKRYTTKTMEVVRIPQDCNIKDPTDIIGPYTPDTNPVIDPSGYVYEAVPENRVEGVQATIYYKERVEDMYGDLHDNIVLWNAEEYAQQNPLFTDENGMYQWDVPQGLWQVKFEKDGYLTAYSDWLPVPPPQLDVNIGIVQNKQPEVTEARAYEEGVEVQFDKFMDISTLNPANIYVTADDVKLNGEIRLVDSSLADEFASEENPDATRYASRVRFVPEQPLSITTGEIALFVSRNVLSYAGIPMTQNFTQVLDVEKEVGEIQAKDTKVLYGADKAITVFALPAEAAAGRTLRITNSSDLITSVDKTEAVLDAEGKAVITVSGKLPGHTELSFKIDDVTVTGQCAVDVVTEMVTAEAPVSSRASGSAVYRGTKVELTTDSKNGVIYFTTDGSCPCDADGTRRKYTVPIVINEDTHILAMTSVGTGDEDVSETAEFNYTLKRSDMDFAMPEGWTWISHNFESPVTAATLAADENVHRIMSQTQEAIRDPQLGLVGTLKDLAAPQSYKVETTAATTRQRISDVAWNPATPIALQTGWNWLGYPVAQTMSVDEAFAHTDVQEGDVVVGQSGFAEFDGAAWVGTLQTLEPGHGYMYQSLSDKDVVYNTSIVSNAAALNVPGITSDNGLALDIHKYPNIMPVVVTLQSTDGTELDNEAYRVYAFNGTECRGIGRLVNNLVMMNVYGNSGDKITFQVTDAAGSVRLACTTELPMSEKVVGSLNEPYPIAVSNATGINSVSYSGNVKVYISGDMLRITGIDPQDISLVEVYDVDGHKLIHETSVSDAGIRVSHLTTGVYVVIVNGNGEYTYHKVSVR